MKMDPKCWFFTSLRLSSVKEGHYANNSIFAS